MQGLHYYQFKYLFTVYTWANIFIIKIRSMCYPYFFLEVESC